MGHYHINLWDYKLLHISPLLIIINGTINIVLCTLYNGTGNNFSWVWGTPYVAPFGYLCIATVFKYS